MAVSLKKSPASSAQSARFKSMSIAEALADKEARNAFGLATGFSMDDTDTHIDREARRARWARRKARK